MRFPRDPFRSNDPRADAFGALVAALVLTGIGIICVFSFGGSHVVRQAIWAVVGGAACLVVSRIPLDLLRRGAGWALFLTTVLLCAALLFAPVIEGTRRWLVIGSIGTFQPSELAKLAVVLYLARRLAEKGGLDRGLLPLCWPVLLVMLLVLIAPDLGTALFIGLVGGAMLLIGGARVGRLVAVVAGGLPVLLFMAARHPYMAQRLAFFEGKLNYQQDQALVALGSGGFLGHGLGAGRQKMDYLPAGHTDFVLPNVGEELGFLGVALILVLFALIAVYGLRVALAAARSNRFGFYLACGATLVVVAQAVLNVAVATAAAPTKGISLPFLSQGGSNLLMALVAVGLVVNVGRNCEKVA